MKPKVYVVTFVGEYFTMEVHVSSFTNNHGRLVAQASGLMESQYGWDLDATGRIYQETHVHELDESDLRVVEYS